MDTIRAVAVRVSLGVLLLAAAVGRASPVTGEAAATAAQVFLSANPAFGIPHPQRGDGWTVAGEPLPFLAADGTLLGYIVKLAPKGFMVIAADDAAEPVVFLSTEVEYREALGVPAPLRALLRHDLPARLARAKAQSAETQAANRSLWRPSRDEGAVPESTLSIATYPLLTSTWNQSAPYNHYAPGGYPAGCAALAAAQVVRYYNYPPRVDFTGSYRVDFLDGRTTHVRETFDYELMLDSVAGRAITDPAADAVAKLVWAMGPACGVNYCGWGTGALPNAVVNGFRYAFGYTAGYDPCEQASQDLLRINGEVLSRRPVILMIWPELIDAGPLGTLRNPLEGHYVVADGAALRTSDNRAGVFHLNFGWEGTCDGWYWYPTYDANDKTYWIEGEVYGLRPPTVRRVDIMGQGDFRCLGWNGAAGHWQDAAPEVMATVKGSVGNNVYLPTVQVDRVDLVAGQGACHYYVFIQNEGTEIQYYYVRGTRGDSQTSVAYYNVSPWLAVSDSDITSSVAGVESMPWLSPDGWLSPEVRPGKILRLRVDLGVTAELPLGATRDIVISASTFQATTVRDEYVIRVGRIEAVPDLTVQPPGDTEYRNHAPTTLVSSGTWTSFPVHLTNVASVAMPYRLGYRLVAPATLMGTVLGRTPDLSGWQVRVFELYSGGARDVTDRVRTNTYVYTYPAHFVESLRVDVQPPASAPSGAAATVILRAEASSDRTVADECRIPTAKVLYRPFADIRAGTTGDYQDAAVSVPFVDGPMAFEVLVTNGGNTTDDLDLTATGVSGTTGWAATVAAVSFGGMAAGAQCTTMLDVRPPTTVPSGHVAVFSVRVASRRDPSATDTVRVTITKPLVSPALAVTLEQGMPNALDAWPGNCLTPNNQEAILRLAIRNDAPTADSFHIVATEAYAAGWTLRYEGNGVPLGSDLHTSGWTTPVLQPAQSTILRVGATPGPTVAGMSYCQITVTGTSQTTPTLSNRVVLGPRKLEYRFDAHVQRTSSETLQEGPLTLATVRGTPVTFLAWVTNAGMGPDTATVQATWSGAAGGWDLRYYLVDNDEATPDEDITARLTAPSTWSTGELGVPAARIIRAEVTPGTSLPAGAGGVLTLTARSQAIPAVTDEVRVYVGTPSYRPELTTRVTGTGSYGVGLGPVEAGPATPVSFDFCLTNGGGGADTFTVQPTLSQAGPGTWTVAFTRAGDATPIMAPGAGGLRAPWTVGPLAAGATAEFTALVTPGADVTGAGRLVVHVDATSHGDPERTGAIGVIVLKPTGRVDLEVQTEAGYSDTAPAGLSASGAEVYYQFVARNRGNTGDRIRWHAGLVGANAGSWTVHYTAYDAFGGRTEIDTPILAEDGWTTDYLASGWDSRIGVTLTPGAGVPGGDSVDLTIEADSVGTPGVGDQIVAHVTKCGPSRPAMQLRVAGETVWTDASTVYAGATPTRPAVYQVRIRNAGTVPDSFGFWVQGPSADNRAPTDWSLAVYDAFTGGGLITAQVAAGTWLVGPLLPGVEVSYRIELTPAQSVVTGERVYLQVHTWSATDPSDQSLRTTLTPRATRTTFGTVTLAPSPAAPQPPARDIALTAGTEAGIEGLEFRFIVDGVVHREWEAAATYTWHPTVEGTYNLKVVAREAANTQAFADSLVVPYVVRSPASRILPATCSSPGFIDVVVLLDYAGTDITGLTLTEQLPAGWSFDRAFVRPLPDVLPEHGATGELVFTWNAAPPMPFRFSYRVRVPAGVTGNQAFTGSLRYTTPAGRGVTDLVVGGTTSSRVAFAITEVSPADGATGVGTTTVSVPGPTAVPEGTETTFSVTATDGTLPYQYVWTVNGSDTGGRAATFVFNPDASSVAHPEQTGPDREVACRVTDAAATVLTATWQIVHAVDSDRPAPAPGTLTLSPAAPVAGQSVTVEASAQGVDPDGDAILGHEFAWACDDYGVPFPGPTLDGSLTRKGQVWQVTARAITNPYGEPGGDVASTLAATLEVTIGNTAPVALSPDVLYVPTDGALAIHLAGDDPDVLAGVDSLTFTIVDEPAHGGLSGLTPENGLVGYAPDLHFAGLDQFTFTVSDGGATAADPGVVRLLVYDGWILPIKTANNVVDQLVLGVSAGAAADLDALDLAFPGGQPSLPTGTCRLLLAGLAAPTYLQRDLRDDGREVWDLEAESLAGFELNLVWETAALPPDGLWLWEIDTNTGDMIADTALDMTACTNLTMPAGSVHRYRIGRSYPGATGTLQVTTNQADASFAITGPAAYTGTGTSWTQAGAPTGDYTIIYGAVAGYRTPLPQARFLRPGQTLALTGTYVDPRTWGCTIALTHADRTSVTLGMEAGAADGFGAEDTVANPAPPTGVGGAFFYSPAIGTELSRDLRALGDTAEWVLFVTPGATPVGMSWPAPALLPGMLLTLVEIDVGGQVVGTMVNMAATTQLTVDGAATRYFRLHYGPPPPLTITAVSPGSGSGTTVTVTSAVTVAEGQTQTFTVTPHDGVPPYLLEWELLSGGNWLPRADGVLAPGFDHVVHPAIAAEHSLRCLVTDSAGRAVATVVWQTVTITDTNRPPDLGTTAVSVSGLTLTGANGGVGTADDLRATLTGEATDADPEDVVRYRFVWTDTSGRALLRDTVAAAGVTADTLPASATTRGAPVTVTVTAVDYAGVTAVGGASAAATHATVPIANTPPAIPGAAIDHDADWQTLTVTPDGWSDADGDPAGYRYQWWRGDAVIGGATSATLTRPAFTRTDRISCVVTPWDGEHEGKPCTAPAVDVPTAAWLWQVAIDVQGLGDPAQVAFGMQPESSDGLDDGLDAAAAAPLPGTAAVYLRTPAGLILARDARAVAAVCEYTLVVAGSAAGPIRLSWSVPAASLPPGMYLSLYEVVEGVTPAERVPVGGSALNMGTTSELTVPAGESAVLVIRYAADLTTVLAFLPGWNLFSLPVQPFDPAVDAVLDDTPGRKGDASLRDGTRGVIYSGSIWTWDPSYVDTAHPLLPPGRYVQALRLDALVGYWAYATAPGCIVVRGLPPAATGFNLVAGWNLVGVPRAMAAPTHASLRGGCSRWDAETALYEVVTTLYAGDGHWLFAVAAVTIPFGGR